MTRAQYTPNPMQLASLGFLLSVAAATAFFLLPRAFLPRPNLAVVLAFLVTILFVLGLYLWAAMRLKNGIHKKLWPEADLASLRSFALSPYLKWTAYILIAIFFILTLVKSHRTDLGLFPFFVGIYLSQLRLYFRMPAAVDDSTAARPD